MSFFESEFLSGLFIANLGYLQYGLSRVILNVSVSRIKVVYFDGKHYKSDDIHIRTNNCAVRGYNYICLGHQNISDGLI